MKLPLLCFSLAGAGFVLLMAIENVNMTGEIGVGVVKSAENALGITVLSLLGLGLFFLTKERRMRV